LFIHIFAEKIIKIRYNMRTLRAKTMMRTLSKVNFKKIKVALLIVGVMFCVFSFALLFVNIVHAQTTDFETFGTASGLPTTNIAILVARIIRAVLGIVGILLTIIIIYGGFLYLTASGSPDKIKKAHAIFKNAGIGLIIIFSSFALATFILGRLLDAAFTGSQEAIAARYSEPLSGSLGAGILEDHYPERDAIDIPRNTRIFVTFKEPINPASIIEGYKENPSATSLNTQSVLIYETDLGADSALEGENVVVTYNESFETFVFDPVEYLGNDEEEDTNYTVVLTSAIEKADGSRAFTGTYANDYEWTFEVSTEVDLTPPYIVNVIPQPNASEPRNVTIEINFSEPMDPVASTGTYSNALDEFFTNIEARNASGAVIDGVWEIGNGYRTIDLTTFDACGEDPCGGTIYCLPTNQRITAIAHAARLNPAEIPQALPYGINFDGLVDAAMNSLDGDNSGDVCGSDADAIECANGNSNDDYNWTFFTTDEVNDTVPQIVSIDPGINEGNISATDDLSINFNTLLKSSTVNATNVSLWPDPWYEMWFAPRNNFVFSVSPPLVPVTSRVMIEHPMFVSVETGGWDYWPVLTQGIRSVYQICMYPAIGPNSCSETRSLSAPYCCNGVPSGQECITDSGDSLPDNKPTR
jgi:hypothetical protein